MTRDEAKKVCEERALSGEPFTFAELDRHLCHENGGKLFTTDGGDCFRIADATIQRLRKAGKIAFTKEGRTCIWNVVKGGAA